MQAKIVQLPYVALAYEKYGDGDVNLVIEMGLGASMAEWKQLATKLAGRYTVLFLLLQQVGHDQKVAVLAHSQGGLYAWKFARMYPDLVDKLILLDPLSPEDYRFRMELTEEEFRKSGVDKTAGLRQNLCLCERHLGWLVRRFMRAAPPFYYYKGFSKAESSEILSGIGKPQTYQTALAEYAAAHDMKQLAGLLNKENMLNIPVVLITHNSDIAEKEIREFGGASDAQARKIEALWQEVMQVYLTCTPNGMLIRAKNSSHYIHLTDSELICGIL